MTTCVAHSLADFVKRYGIGRTKVYEEIKAGRLKALKVGKRTIIAESDAQAWLASLPSLDTNKPS